MARGACTLFWWAMLNRHRHSLAAMSGDHGDDEFRRTIGDVRPLKRVKPRVDPPRKRVTVEPALPRSSELTDRSSSPSVQVGRMAGVDRRTAERLRRGKLGIDARLDLHGHTQDAAHAALTEFIAASVAQGRRCVLIVTGKGTVSQGGGVLRRRVPDWLNLPPCRGHVVAIEESQRHHGGSGALYVLLRRARNGAPR